MKNKLNNGKCFTRILRYTKVGANCWRLQIAAARRYR